MYPPHYRSQTFTSVYIIITWFIIIVFVVPANCYVFWAEVAPTHITDNNQKPVKGVHSASVLYSSNIVGFFKTSSKSYPDFLVYDEV